MVERVRRRSHSQNPAGGDAVKANLVVALEGNGTRDSHNGNGYSEDDVSYTLNSVERHAVCSPQPLAIEMTSTKNTIIGDGISPTLTARMGTGGNQVNAVCFPINTMASRYSKNGTQEAMNGMYIVSCCGSDDEKIAGTLDASYYKGVGARNGNERTVVAVDCRNGSEAEVNGTLQAHLNGGTSLNTNNVVRQNYIVRRLTPRECERLQGYPDGWCDIGEWTDSKGKKHKDADSPKYKALGNSIALPYWQWMLGRMIGFCKDGTMASLFDGIGGFPLCWLRVGGVTLWASEIEEYPIAVTKYHFGED